MTTTEVCNAKEKARDNLKAVKRTGLKFDNECVVWLWKCKNMNSLR